MPSTSTPKLPFEIPHIPRNRDHKALNRGTLGGLGTCSCCLKHSVTPQALSKKARGTLRLGGRKDHRIMRILQTMASGIPRVLGLFNLNLGSSWYVAITWGPELRILVLRTISELHSWVGLCLPTVSWFLPLS